MVSQTEMARIERLIEKIGEFWYQGKLRERLSHSRGELLKSKVVGGKSKIRDGALEAKGSMGHPKQI